MRRSPKSGNVLAHAGVGIGFAVLIGILVFQGSAFRLLSGILAVSTVTPEEEYQILPKAVLASRVADLERELAKVRYQAVLYQELALEVVRLEEILRLPGAGDMEHARVVARPPQTHYDSLVLALSVDHRVSVGDLVFFEQVLVGSVAEVGGRTALVALFSRPGARTDARVGDPSGIVILEGLGGGAFTFDIPREVSVVPGDAVVSASDERALIGTVARVVEDPNKTVKTVYVRLPVSLSDVRYVSIRSQNPL